MSIRLFAWNVTQHEELAYFAWDLIYNSQQWTIVQPFALQASSWCFFFCFTPYRDVSGRVHLCRHHTSPNLDVTANQCRRWEPFSFQGAYYHTLRHTKTSLSSWEVKHDWRYYDAKNHTESYMASFEPFLYSIFRLKNVESWNNPNPRHQAALLGNTSYYSLERETSMIELASVGCNFRHFSLFKSWNF